jgi:hypothetical protein
MGPSHSDEIPLRKILTVLRQMYGTTGGIKQVGTHDRLERGRGARVALCAHSIHTLTLTLIPRRQHCGKLCL